MFSRIGEISVKGKWRVVPILDYHGKRIVTAGTWFRLARPVDEEWLDAELENPESCVKILKSQVQGGLHADILTFAQKLPNTIPKYAYHFEWDSVAALQTICFRKWWESLPRQTRQNVRKAQKSGLQISVKPLNDELIRGMVRINDSSPIRQGTFFVHYKKTFEEVKKDHLAFLDRSDFICAYSDDELIGFIWLVYRGQIASILQILTKVSDRDKRPANALIQKAVELCASKGLLYLTFGAFNYGNKRHTSLREFKERNGFKEFLVPRYYIPLTSWGRFCLKANFHRGLLRLVPHGAIMAALRVRSILVKLTI